MSLGNMTSALVLMGLLAAAVAVSLVWPLPVGVLGTSTRVLADPGLSEAAPLLGIRVRDDQLVGPNPLANLALCLFGTGGLDGDITIVFCLNSTVDPLSVCATGVTAVNSAAVASGGTQPTYARIFIASETDAAGVASLGTAVATTLLTADGPAAGVFASFFFPDGTTNATANLELVLSFYQAIVDNAEFTGSSLVLGISLSATNQCLNPGAGTAPPGTFYMADNSSSLAARMDALGEGVVAVLRLPITTLPAEGDRCGFSESRIVPLFSGDILPATNADCSVVNDAITGVEISFFSFPADYLPEGGGGGGEPDGGEPDGGEPDGGEPDGGEPDGGEPDGDGDGDGVSSVGQLSGVIAVLCAVAMLFL